MLLAIWLARSAGATRSDRGTRPDTGGGNVSVCRCCGGGSRCSCSVRRSRAVAGALFVHVKGFANPDDFGINLGLGDLRDAHPRRHRLALGAGDRRRVLRVRAAVAPGRDLRDLGPRRSTVTCSARSTASATSARSSSASLLVLTMIAFPEGIVGIGRRLARRSRSGKSSPSAAPGSATCFGITHRRSATRWRAPTAPPPAFQRRRSTGGRVRRRARDDRHAVARSRGHPGAVRWRRRRRRREPRRCTRARSSVWWARTAAARPRSSTRSPASSTPTGSLRGRRRAGRARPARAHPTVRRAAHVPGAADLRPPHLHRGRAAVDDRPPVHRHVVVVRSLRPLMDGHERERWAAAIGRARPGRPRRPRRGADRRGSSYGQRRLLELARAIYGEPKALMLDEPSAGLNASETDAARGVPARPRATTASPSGSIDHKLDFITSLCDRVAVLELGQLVAVGPSRDGVRGPARRRRLPRRRRGRLMLEIERRRSVVRRRSKRCAASTSTVATARCVALIGPNGAGKTSTLRAISGLVPYRGSITFDGAECRKLGVEGCARQG